MATQRAFCPNSDCGGILTFEAGVDTDDETEVLATCPVCDTEWSDWEMGRYGTWLDETAVDGNESE